jgi:hypothetical protein
MKKNHRLFWFGGLALAFIFLIIGITDLKSPQTLEDKCMMIGQGEQVGQFINKAKWLYGKNGKPENNIALACKQLGAIMLNDELLLPAKNGQQFELVQKSYHYLPNRYHLYLPVNNSDPVETESNRPPSPKQG